MRLTIVFLELGEGGIILREWGDAFCKGTWKVQGTDPWSTLKT